MRAFQAHYASRATAPGPVDNESDDSGEVMRECPRQEEECNQLQGYFGDEGDSAEFQTALVKLIEIFPMVDIEKAADALRSKWTDEGLSLDVALEHVMELYLSNGCPRREEPQPPSRTDGEAGPSKAGEARDIFEAVPLPEGTGSDYHEWTTWQLMQDFPMVGLPDLRRALKAHKSRYAATYKAIRSELDRLHEEKAKGNSPDTGEGPFWTGSGLRLLKKRRDKRKRPPDTQCEIFQAELDQVRALLAKDQEQQDWKLAQEVNAEEYTATGQEIECGCCVMEHPFERMVQCADGHLFCFDCLKRRVEESTFGGLSASGTLPCMDTEGCEAAFPPSEIRRAIPPQTLAKYEQRQATEALMKAQIQLVECPFCEFAVDLPEEQRVLECPSCKRSSCRLCREPDHIPLKCSEVEKKSETAFRTRVEELMSKALIRECVGCKRELLKQEGCNKVTCPCGQTICYVCRTKIPPDYTHFCQHVREPSLGCTQCKRCSLWVQEDELAVVREVRNNAIREAAYLCPEAAEKMIGAPDDMMPNTRAAKRAKQAY